MNLKRLTDGKTALLLALGLLLLLGALALNRGGESDGASADERRIAQVLEAMAGVGEVEVALFYARGDGAYGGGASGPPTGAVVVARGAENMEVRLSLIRAVRTLLGLPEKAVDVFVMEDGE